MKTIRRLIYGEVIFAVTFVIVGFLSLFFFFDFVEEIQSLGRHAATGYRLIHALAYVTLMIPSHLYELLPITVLIAPVLEEMIFRGWQTGRPRALWLLGCFAAFVALVIGMLQALGLIAEKLNLSGGVWDMIGAVRDRFDVLGFVIVGLFMFAWGASALVWRYGGFAQGVEREA